MNAAADTSGVHRRVPCARCESHVEQIGALRSKEDRLRSALDAEVARGARAAKARIAERSSARRSMIALALVAIAALFAQTFLLRLAGGAS